MIKVFISHSLQDKKFVNQLSSRMKSDGIEVWTNEKELTIGDNIAEKINDAIRKMDYILVVLSKHFSNSIWSNFEISATRLMEISKQKNIIIPILLEDTEFPGPLLDRMAADFRYSFEDGYEKLIAALKSQKTKDYQKIDPSSKKLQAESYDYHIKGLKEAYNEGNLTLFCGAGVSYDSGIPTWNNLLKSLLKAVYSDNQEVPNLDTHLSNLFQKRINVSPLILAQYLKTLLGKKFTSTVRDTLYKECTDKSKTIDSIADLSRQKRNRKPLKAIVTFNFDDLIENKLTKEKIDFRTIFGEGERFKDEEIPIYHPHGYLPRDRKLTAKNDIVFSEDAYHTQFIDPFSWSNLIQLSHLNNSTCLFFGISLTDPNMRRLLDVSIRKNGKGEKNHYIIKKHYAFEDLFSDDDRIKDIKVIPILENIEEQDANNLGFNVIWINQFKEIPEILTKIGYS